jgi:hypothetical protein
MDGNSRWARRRGLPPTLGHESGVTSLRACVRACAAWGVRALTVFAFSSENFAREADEVAFLLALLERVLEREAADLAAAGVRLRALCSDPQRLTPALRARLREAEERTAGGQRLLLTVAIGEGVREARGYVWSECCCCLTSSCLVVSRLPFFSLQVTALARTWPARRATSPPACSAGSCPPLTWTRRRWGARSPPRGPSGARGGRGTRTC